MEVVINQIDDSDNASKFPMCVERGPLVFALPVPEKWGTYAGRPITPLPEGWSWYTLNADWAPYSPNGMRFTGYINAPWAKAMGDQVLPSHIIVEEHDTDGYVWEDPPISLQVPLYHAPYVFMTTASRTHETWEIPARTVGEQHMCKFVPHGCTNLRITLLPRAKLADC